jgi:hypothetical protein
MSFQVGDRVRVIATPSQLEAMVGIRDSKAKKILDPNTSMRIAGVYEAEVHMRGYRDGLLIVTCWVLTDMIVPYEKTICPWR